MKNLLIKLLFFAVICCVFCGCIRIRKDDVIIYSTSGKKIEKAIWNHDNWNCNGSFWNGWHMTFVIKEDDLE